MSVESDSSQCQCHNEFVLICASAIAECQVWPMPILLSQQWLSQSLLLESTLTPSHTHIELYKCIRHTEVHLIPSIICNQTFKAHQLLTLTAHQLHG